MDLPEKNEVPEYVSRFLQTAVIVDDEAYIATTPNPLGKLTQPTLKNRPTNSKNRPTNSKDQDSYPLDAGTISNSFSDKGIICGVVGPKKPNIETIKQADIVVLDWYLEKYDESITLNLLKKLLGNKKNPKSLRLVAIYTSKAELYDIRDKVKEKLQETGLNPKSELGANLLYQNGWIVIYAKSSTKLSDDLKNRSVAEKDLPERLIQDFASMTNGLLPGIVLTSLAAVRQNSLKILDQFSSDLDPAYLTQKACISNPAESEQQIVNLLAEEIRGLMNNAVAKESPGGTESIKNWLGSNLDKNVCIEYTKNKCTITILRDQIIALAYGEPKIREKHKDYLNRKAAKELTTIFSGLDESDSQKLDERLAWIINFRTIYGSPPPTLWLGSVITELSGKKRDLLCIRPRCDSVRLGEATKFIFLHLQKPTNQKNKHLQIVLKIDDEFQRLGVDKKDFYNWVSLEFPPVESTKQVQPQLQGNDLIFTDTCKQEYMWQGELKFEFAQRIVQTIVEKLGRVAVDESEWLRNKINQ